MKSGVQREVRVQLNPSETQATIKVHGISRPIVAPVLGIERKATSTRIYLRSRIHTDKDDWTGWVPSGAISTILTKLHADSCSGGQGRSE